jgi:hypothetical protein
MKLLQTYGTEVTPDEGLVLDCLYAQKARALDGQWAPPAIKSVQQVSDDEQVKEAIFQLRNHTVKGGMPSNRYLTMYKLKKKYAR